MTVAPDLSAFIADQILTEKYDDWPDCKLKVAEYILSSHFGDHVWTNPELAVEALERAYKAVKAE